MERTLEPQLMEDAAQVKAYAEADFNEPNTQFVALFKEIIPAPNFTGIILDLGCGPGDITIRLAKEYPACCVHGVDGSKPMLDHGRRKLNDPDQPTRVKFIQALIPNSTFPFQKYNAIVSNSLLHHLPDPAVLWSTIKSYATNDTAILVMDLMRPESKTKALKLVETYAADEAEILKRDFYNSLLAAFSIEEIKTQLVAAGLANLEVEQVSDRHVCIKGHID